MSSFMTLSCRKVLIKKAGLCCLIGLTVFPASVVGKAHGQAVRIGAGRLNSAEWISTLTKWRKNGVGPEGVCLSTALATRANEVNISEGFECDTVRDDAPFIQSDSGHSRKGMRTVFAAIFSPATARVVVDLGRGDGSTVGLKRLSETQARQLGVERVRYWVHAFSGPACLQGLTTCDRFESILSESTFGC